MSTANNTSEAVATAPRAKARATKLDGSTLTVNTGHGKMYVTVNYDNDQVYENGNSTDPLSENGGFEPDPGEIVTDNIENLTKKHQITH